MSFPSSEISDADPGPNRDAVPWKEYHYYYYYYYYYHQGPDFDDISSFFPCEIDDAIQYINLGYGSQAQKILENVLKWSTDSDTNLTVVCRHQTFPGFPFIYI